jgi:hypothetical protein
MAHSPSLAILNRNAEERTIQHHQFHRLAFSREELISAPKLTLRYNYWLGD